MKTESNTLNIAEIIDNSMISGPGRRCVIWVQGCSLQCPGCRNEEFQSFEPKHLLAVEELYDKIMSVANINGITITGGEPLHQSEQLLRLIKRISPHGLTVMLYTGFTRDEIDNDAALYLFDSADVVVSGRYVEELQSPLLKWRGSTNQIIIFQNVEYREHYSSIDEENEVEIHINDHGMLTIIGFPEKKHWEDVPE